MITIKKSPRSDDLNSNQTNLNQKEDFMSGKIIEINEEKIKDHLGSFVKNTVEETLNAMLDAEADAICNAQRYERSPERLSLKRMPHTDVWEKM
jgi:hypothetical protein